MRSLRFALVTVAAVAACTTKDARRSDTAAPAAATLAGAPASDAAVRQAIDSGDARFSAAALKGDTAAIAGLYVDDAIVMMSNVPAARGHDAIAKTFGGMMSAMKLSAFRLQTQDVIVTGDYAVETGTYNLTRQAAAKGAKPHNDVGKYLVLWKKQLDGSYKMVRDIANSDLPPMK